MDADTVLYKLSVAQNLIDEVVEYFASITVQDYPELNEIADGLRRMRREADRAINAIDGPPEDDIQF